MWYFNSLVDLNSNLHEKIVVSTLTVHHRVRQAVNEVTGKVSFQYDLREYVPNGATVYNITSYLPKQPENRVGFLQNSDGSIQTGILNIGTDGKVTLSAYEVNTSIRGSFTIEYQYK